MVTLRDTRLYAAVLILAILGSLIGLSGCSSLITTESNTKSSVVSTQTSGQNRLALLQKNQSCSVRLFALMTFNAFDQNFSYPTEFKMMPINITWMGPIFTGRLQTVGPGSGIYEVHGGASQDGNWIETMYYLVNTFQPNAQFGMFYRVTLRNLPLEASPNNLTAWTPSFEMSGSEVQKYVVKIEYSGSGKYVSTDWQTQDQGQAPNLRVEFLSEPPLQPTGSGNGMMN